MRGRDGSPPISSGWPRWRLEAGEEIDPVLAESAAMLARHAGDFPLMLRLARAAHAGRPTMRTGILLGEALYETGGWPESEAVLAAADSLDGTPAEVLRLVGQRGTNLLFGLLDPDRARRVTDDAAPRLAGEGLGSLRDELVSRRRCCRSTTVIRRLRSRSSRVSTCAAT